MEVHSPCMLTHAANRSSISLCASEAACALSGRPVMTSMYSVWGSGWGWGGWGICLLPSKMDLFYLFYSLSRRAQALRDRGIAQVYAQLLLDPHIGQAPRLL